MLRLVVLLALLPARLALGGAANIELDCASASGRTTLKGQVPGDMEEFELTFVIDGKARRHFSMLEQQPPYKTVENASIEMKGHPGKKAFGFTVTRLDAGKPTGTALTAKAIASTMTLEKTADGQRGRFNLTVQGDDPREATPTPSKVIELACTWRWEI